MKVYIASPFFDHAQLARVKFIESEFAGFGIDFFSPRSVGPIKDLPIEEKRKASAQIYKSNIDNIRDCNILLAVLDDSDTGTIFELGYAVAWLDADDVMGNTWSDRKIITINFTGKGLNVMLRECVDIHLSGVLDFVDVFQKIAAGEEVTERKDDGDIE